MDYLLEQCSVPIVLTQERFRETVRWPACVRTILCDFPDPDDPPKPLLPAQGPDDLAYVIFTSGSSGLPKGVEIDHRGAVNTIVDVNRRFGIGPGDRVLALSSLSFDLSVYDVFGLLAAGGTVVVPGAADVRDAARWLQLLEEHQVTVWNSVPALMQILCEYAASHSRALPASLRLVLLSGDWIPVGLPGAIRSLSERGQGLAVVSLGGATEASIWSIFHPVDVVDPSWPSIPYGRPLGNQAMHVLDGEFWPRPDWVAGDLYIEGVGLARGYRGDAERTSAAFVENPRTRRRLYRTGDLARYRPDGTMEFLGRADSQVKIQGYRVEPGEIEANLRQHAGVRHAMAFVVGEPQHEKRLVAAVVGNADQAPSPEALREFLAASLPDYMVPSLLLVLDAFPLTGNGKVDMRALAGMASDPGREAVAASGPSDASDPFTQKLIQLVKTELQLQDLDADTNLLNLGANSLDMLRLVNEIELHLGFRPRIEEFFRRPTITGLRELRRRFEASDQAAPAGPAGPATPSYEASDLVLDPRERDALKRRSLEVRQFEAGRARVPLHVVSTDGLEPGVFAARRTHREFDPRPVALEALSSTLGCLSGAWVAGRGGHRYASAGGLYPVQTYLHVKEGRVEGIPQGTYYYDPLGQDLVLLRGGVAIEAGTHAPQNQPIHIASAFTIFLVAETEFLKALYGDLSIHLATLEAGLMTELLDLTGPRHGIGLCQIGAIRFDGIREFFDLKDSHVLVHTVLGGRIPGSASGPAGPDGREEGTV